MMTEKMPIFKEQINNIQVPVDQLDQIIANTVEEHAPKRKRNFRRKLIYSVSAAMIAFGLLIGSATVSPAMANIVSKVPIIGSVFIESHDAGLINASEQGFTQIIGESKQVGNKVLTIEEAFYDGVRLTISYFLKTETPIDARYFSSGPSFKIDGQRYEANTYRAENEITPTFHTGFLEVEVADELPNEFIVDLVFSGHDRSRWTFEIPIQLKTSADFIKVNHHEQVASIDLTVKEISNGAGGLKLNYELTSEYELLQHLGVNFHIKDSLGNEVLELASGGLIGSGNWKEFIGNATFNPIDEDAKEITITPYFYLITEENMSPEEKALHQEIIEDRFESFTIDLSK